MRLDLTLGYWTRDLDRLHELLRCAEDTGYGTIWLGEAYGADAVSPLAWLASRARTIGFGTSVLQIAARTPAMTAMTAMSLHHLSPGGFRLGLGVSGPQVVEGWHGTPYGKPLQRTREYVEVVRAALARTGPLTYDGDYYRLPLTGEGTTGLGKPLRLIGEALPDLPIYLAANGPRNVALTAEIADGWLPAFYAPAHSEELQGGDLLAAARPGFDVCPTVQAFVGDDVDACRDLARPMLALYLGGMGARGRNFYHDLAVRYGYEEAADTVQDLYLDGRKDEAAAAVPDALVDAVSLCGPPSRIAELAQLWKAAPITSLSVLTTDPLALTTVAEAFS